MIFLEELNFKSSFLPMMPKTSSKRAQFEDPLLCKMLENSCGIGEIEELKAKMPKIFLEVRS